MEGLDQILRERTVFESRVTQVYVPGKEMSLAHIISGPNEIIYEKLSLEPNVKNLSKWAIGIMKFTPWETSFVAADIAMDTSDVELGFADRFTGTVVITGYHENVRIAIEGVRNYMRDTLGFSVCKMTKS